MRFTELSLVGAYRVQVEPYLDERGFFSRLRCEAEFERHGLPSRFVQTNLSFNAATGTFRGLHFQVPPSREGKLVRCIAGGIYDVIVDLRPDSPTYLMHEWVRLDEESLNALYVPPGFAHGFLTASENAKVLYEMTDFYSPELSRGIRLSDPLLKLEPPAEISVISDRDAKYADFDESELRCFTSDVRQ